jgi:hypothetical protein
VVIEKHQKKESVTAHTANLMANSDMMGRAVRSLSMYYFCTIFVFKGIQALNKAQGERYSGRRFVFSGNSQFSSHEQSAK